MRHDLHFYLYFYYFLSFLLHLITFTSEESRTKLMNHAIATKRKQATFSHDMWSSLILLFYKRESVSCNVPTGLCIYNIFNLGGKMSKPWYRKISLWGRGFLFWYQYRFSSNDIDIIFWSIKISFFFIWKMVCGST